MKIVVCIDLSPLTDAVVAEARTLAGWSGATLVLVHAARSEREPDVAQPTPPADMEYHLDRVAALEKQLRDAGVPVESRVVHSTKKPGEVIVEEATKVGAALVVVGSNARGKAFELFIGSTTQTVIHQAHAPVVVVNGLRSVGGPG